jgi:threonine/homoserine/homoserine lactone efflux protein
MAEAIGQALTPAVGVAISPFPIVAVVLMLVTPRGRVNGPVFVLGWLIGLAIVGTIALAIAGGTDASDEGEPATWVSVLKLVLGALLVLISLRQWAGRPHEGDEVAMPKWMRALDRFSPVKAAGAGLLLSALNPKNLMLTVAAAAAIAQTGIPGGEQAVAYIAFAVIATIGVGAPVVMYFGLGDRAPALLDRMKNWMARNNAVIMAVLLLVIGVKLIGDGIAGL